MGITNFQHAVQCHSPNLKGTGKWQQVVQKLGLKMAEMSGSEDLIVTRTLCRTYPSIHIAFIQFSQAIKK
jgi:hypothetical protein